jgi:hypothetical protein
MDKERVRALFRTEDPNFDFESGIKSERGYELIGCKKVENLTNPNWPNWSIIVDYKRCKNK